MAATNELYAFSTDFFTFTSTQSHANSLTGAYPRGYGASIELIKNKEKAFFPPIFTTDRPTDPIIQAKMTGNKNIIDDRPPIFPDCLVNKTFTFKLGCYHSGIFSETKQSVINKLIKS